MMTNSISQNPPEERDNHVSQVEAINRYPRKRIKVNPGRLVILYEI